MFTYSMRKSKKYPNQYDCLLQFCSQIPTHISIFLEHLFSSKHDAEKTKISVGNVTSERIEFKCVKI